MAALSASLSSRVVSYLFRIMVWIMSLVPELMGLVLLPGSFLLPEQVFFVILMAGILGSAGLLTVLSYLWFREKQR